MSSCCHRLTFNVKGFRKVKQQRFQQSSNPATLYYQQTHDMAGSSKMTPLTEKETEEKKKNQQKKEEKSMEAGTKADAEAEGAAEQTTKKETLADDKGPRKLLGKRASKSSPTDIEPDLKKKKLDESKTLDQDKAGSSKGEGKASNKKKAQEQEVFNVPQTPPRTNGGPAPTTPEGIQRPRPINPIYTPARPKGKSRLIKDKPLLEDSTKRD